MTEPSTTDVYQACQANQDCNFSVVGQVCSNNKCTFQCKNDSDCISNGKCSSDNNCDWSGKPVPPLFLPSNSTQKNLDATNPDEKTTDNKLSSPLVIAIIAIVATVVVLCLAVTMFFVCRRKKLAEASRGLKPLHLTGSRTSVRKSKRDSREKERSSKKYQHDDSLIGSDDEGKDDFEDSYSPAAVGIQGTHRLPQRSQTMYGTSTPSTVELNVDYPVPQHHFMAEQQQQIPYLESEEQQQQIPYMESEEQQQQQHHYTGEDQQQQQ